METPSDKGGDSTRPTWSLQGLMSEPSRDGAWRLQEGNRGVKAARLETPTAQVGVSLILGWKLQDKGAASYSKYLSKRFSISFCTSSLS